MRLPAISLGVFHMGAVLLTDLVPVAILGLNDFVAMLTKNFRRGVSEQG